MKYDDFQNHLKSTVNFLRNELAQFKAGRANPALVEDIMVHAYEGSDSLPLKEVASVTVPENQSILVFPWDKSIIKKIEDAIRNSGKSLNPVNEGDQIRVPIPPLTEERRKELVKEIARVVEQAKIRIRTIRQDVIKSIEEQENNGIISEDDMFRQKKEVELEISKANKELEEMGELKEVEVMSV